MDSSILTGNWNQLKGIAKEQWGKLTEDELMKVDGNFDKLVGKIEEKYGKTKDDAIKEINEFLKKHNK